MKEHPILFSGPMVRALLTGRKTQTRRVLSKRDLRCIDFVGAAGDSIDDPSNWGFEDEDGMFWLLKANPARSAIEQQLPCPYGQPGDRLWVRETFNRTNPGGKDGIFYYRADGKFPWGTEFDGLEVWKPSIFMPRQACRILLEIVSVRVERLNEISEEDAEAEGVEENMGIPQMECDDQVAHYPDASFVKSYRSLWDSLNAKRGFGWEVNPWVWVIEFKMVAL